MVTWSSERARHNAAVNVICTSVRPALVSCLVALLAATAIGQGFTAQPDAPRRWPAGHADHGLPDPAAVWAPYHQQAEHVLNRLFRSFYLLRAVPTEVASALPAEHGAAAEYFVPGWYFGKRAGDAADERLFGGDGRQMPREGFTADEAAQLRSDLAALDDAVIAELHAAPRLAIWFQHDLLRMARRLLDTKQNADLLAPLFAAARKVALPRAVLKDEQLATFVMADLAKVRPDIDATSLVELERRSTRLFDAEYVQLWSSIFVAMPAGAEPGLDAWLGPADKKKKPLPVPIGTHAVLVQGIVALDDAGGACATPLVIEVRVQDLRNRSPLAADNATTTHDGVDFAMWSLERERVRLRGAATSFADFRALDMQSQELFRDYGTRKHTTYAAQCTLCHRRSNGPEEELAGFSVLRPHVGPRRVVDAGERRRKAEAELGKFIAALAATR